MLEILFRLSLEDFRTFHRFGESEGDWLEMAGIDSGVEGVGIDVDAPRRSSLGPTVRA